MTVASSNNIVFPFTDVSNSKNLQLSTAVPLFVGANLHRNSTQPLDQQNRLEIYGFIKGNSGIHFRGICDGLGLSVGTVQYHLNVLERSGLIISHKDGQNKRYFESNVFQKSDIETISLLRHGTTAIILTILVHNVEVLHKDLAHYLGISSQGLSWQMSQLKKTGLINAEKIGVNVRYSLNHGDSVASVLKMLCTRSQV
jgi:predicted transcriptional regulator